MGMSSHWESYSSPRELQSGEEKETERTQDQSLQSLGPQRIFYSAVTDYTVDGRRNPTHRLKTVVKIPLLVGVQPSKVV